MLVDQGLRLLFAASNLSEYLRFQAICQAIRVIQRRLSFFNQAFAVEDCLDARVKLLGCNLLKCVKLLFLGLVYS